MLLHTYDARLAHWLTAALAASGHLPSSVVPLPPPALTSRTPPAGPRSHHRRRSAQTAHLQPRTTTRRPRRNMGERGPHTWRTGAPLAQTGISVLSPRYLCQRRWHPVGPRLDSERTNAISAAVQPAGPPFRRRLLRPSRSSGIFRTCSTFRLPWRSYSVRRGSGGFIDAALGLAGAVGLWRILRRYAGGTGPCAGICSCRSRRR